MKPAELATHLRREAQMLDEGGSPAVAAVVLRGLAAELTAPSRGLSAEAWLAQFPDEMVDVSGYEEI